MPFTISDQRPAVLDPIHLLPITGTYDPLPAIKQTLVDPLFTPLPSRTVSIVDAKNKSWDQDDVLALLMRTLDGTVDTHAEQDIADLLSQALISFSTQGTLLTNELFANQAGASQKLPAPGTPGLLGYSAATDVLPAAKALLASQGSQEESGFFASLAYTFSPETLGFWFLSESAYEDFRTWFDRQVQLLAPGLPADTLNLLQKFHALTLNGLTESLILRKSDSDELHDSAFARVLVHLLMQYSQDQKNTAVSFEAGVLPFVATELFLPRTVVFVNVEQHARAAASKVAQEWRIIDMALNAPVKVLNIGQLSKLTALPRALAKAASQAANAKSNAMVRNGRAAKVQFRKQAPTSVDIFAGLTRVLRRMKEVNRSQNVFKKTKISFVKANRRDPRDYNKPGKMTSQHFLPDLHVYVDTSGSISEANYQEAVLMLIRLAKKLNVNLFFNSFSDIMSQEVMLHTANKSVSQIWREFQRIPKVTGGTEYEQIWQYINASNRRKEQLSLVISDFEWRARSQRVQHPKNLYYAPCGSMDWDRLVRHAKGFAGSVEHIEPAIASRLIGIVA